MNKPTVRQLLDGELPILRQTHTLQQIANMAGVSRERIRVVLKRFYPSPQKISEREAAEILNTNTYKLEKLRLEKKLSPAKIGKFFSYSNEDIAFAKQLLQRFCTLCGNPLHNKEMKYCRSCANKVIQNRYATIFSPEQKKTHHERCKRWKQRNPEKAKAIQMEASARYLLKKRKEHYKNTYYIVIADNAILPKNTIFQAIRSEHHTLVLANGNTIPMTCVRKYTSDNKNSPTIKKKE